MQGLIWLDDTNNVDFSLFKNYKNALNNYFDNNINLVKDLNDISSLKTIFVIDEHFYPHREFILNKQFIETVNKHKVKIIIFNVEKFLNNHLNKI